MGNESRYVQLILKPLEHHNLRIIAAKEGKQIAPFVIDLLRKHLDLTAESLDGLHAPSDVSGTTSIADPELKSSKK